MADWLWDMRLSTYADYSVRVLMQAALRHPERVTIDDVAGTYGISRNHLVKVVHAMSRAGYLETRRGIGGGIWLGREPGKIRLGEVIRLAERSETVIDCRDGPDRACRLLPCCRLKQVLDEAAGAFFAVLDRYTLADLVERPTEMKSVLGL